LCISMWPQLGAGTCHGNDCFHEKSFLTAVKVGKKK